MYIEVSSLLKFKYLGTSKGGGLLGFHCLVFLFFFLLLRSEKVFPQMTHWIAGIYSAQKKKETFRPGRGPEFPSNDKKSNFLCVSNAKLRP